MLFFIVMINAYKLLLNVQVNAIHIDIIAKILIFGHRKVNYIKYYKDIKKKLTG